MRPGRPEPYVPLFGAILGLESDARVLAARAERGEPTEAAGADAFLFEMTDDIEDSPAKEWLLKDWLGAGECSQWVGDPGSGKSTIVGALAVHVAAGLPWFGLPVTQGGVVYFAGERVDLTRRRIKGLQRYHAIPAGQPFAIASGPLDIAKPDSVRGFIEGVNRFEDQTQEMPALIVLDTWSRVFAGGDENDASAMSAAYAHIDQLRRDTGAHVLLIHHNGVSQEAKRRGRGSSVQTGAIDTSVIVTKAGGGGSAETVKANDGEEGLKISWSLENFVVSTSASGEETTIPVPVTPKGNLSGKLTASPLPAKALTPNQAHVFSALTQAIGAVGVPVPNGEPGAPAGVVTVSLDQWKDAFYEADRAAHPDTAADVRRNRFNRARADLESLKRVTVEPRRLFRRQFGLSHAACA